MSQDTSSNNLTLPGKIIVYLDEIRIILPGTQALLGFQLVAAFSFGFDRISLLFKYMHIISLLLVSISVILLLIPPAFHRIAEHGQDTHRLHVLTTKVIMYAMASLGLGLSVDLFVVVSVILQSVTVGAIVSIIITFLFIFAWYIYPITKRVKVIS